MATDKGVHFSIWVSNQTHEDPSQPDGIIRETMDNVPVGRVFENAMKYMRDEGYDLITIIRNRK